MRSMREQNEIVRSVAKALGITVMPDDDGNLPLDRHPAGRPFTTAEIRANNKILPTSFLIGLLTNRNRILFEGGDPTRPMRSGAARICACVRAELGSRAKPERAAAERRLYRIPRSEIIAAIHQKENKA